MEFLALGIVSLGFGDSPAVTATISVPPNEKAAVESTPNNPIPALSVLSPFFINVGNPASGLPLLLL